MICIVRLQKQLGLGDLGFRTTTVNPKPPILCIVWAFTIQGGRCFIETTGRRSFPDLGGVEPGIVQDSLQ